MHQCVHDQLRIRTVTSSVGNELCNEWWLLTARLNHYRKPVRLRPLTHNS